MSLNIKNPRVHELAREAARRTGKTQTSVIEEALEQLLRGLPDEDSRADRAWAWYRRMAAGRTDEERVALRAAEGDLYDEDGLPA
ncbi:type II toxin-antitoxin system VapB family antitoxin [Nocardioides sp. R-C-SC26]|uniref:type II toxin-antitoxin system VapB family antitoxin n=1 Tax=Nocardioides sp. R-C-SC26 TaxID=2870414 RepID=UPI001E52F5AB|nr:type II toxin-antitoxin system VapB family antitoxin [Nocardioides sp. R-C-SC26]